MFLGSQGSGKTACAVREMLADSTDRMFFSNIITKRLTNNILIKPEMIVNKEPITKPDGTQVMRSGVPQYKYTVNRTFWEEQSKKYDGLNIIIDEAHSVLNARRGMTKQVQPILDWMSLLRRVLGSTTSGYGRLYLISQIERRLDIVAKEQATEIRFHLCHYTKTCQRCGFNHAENNETPEPMDTCPHCRGIMKKHSHFIEVWHFSTYDDFLRWKYQGKRRTYYNHYYVLDIEKVFPYYSTLQWENLLTDI